MAERQLPKLNVAGSIPVSRSIKSITYRIGRNRELHLNSNKRILQFVYGSVTLPSECVSLNRQVLGGFHSSPWSSWRWECGNRFHRFPRFVGRAENSTLVFRAFHKPSFPRPPLVAVSVHAASLADPSAQFCSNVSARPTPWLTVAMSPG